MAISQIQSWYEPLNERESQILSLISEGYSNREIARELSLSLDTIKWYNKQLFSKLGVSSRTQATAAARQAGLLAGPHTQPVEEETHPKHNLPHSPTSFIGRQQELGEIRRLLHSAHLVVLTGPGGSGKTRLALKLAGEMAAHFSDGAWFVELAPLCDPELVPNAIADALGISQRGEATLLSKIKQFLRQKRLLLVLDNFEHLQAASPLVGELITAAPQVTILATSREKLHVYGEQEYPVQPLSLPDPGQEFSTEQLVQSEAVSLFMDRARAVKQDFKLQPGEAAILARICAHLDGLPLALELAASRVKMFSLAALEERLGDRFTLLTGGARNLPERQRALRDTIDWSYNLLETGERLLFARLAVFRGGGALEAIEHICGQDLPHDLLPVLSSLVDKSLVRAREGADGEIRFGMLETIREYALERLNSDCDAAAIHQLHAEFYASFAERAAGELRSRDQRHWFARLRSEYDNLRSALTWSLNAPEIEAGLRITAALRDFWWYTGIHNEYRHWTDLAMERMQDAAPELQAGVMVSASLLGLIEKDERTKDAFLHRAVHLYAQLGDERNKAWATMFLSALIGEWGALLDDQDVDQDMVLALCLESLGTFRRIGDLPGQAQALNLLGEFTRVRGELEASKQYYEQCLQIVAQTGERFREGMLYGNLAFIAYRQGDYPKALQLVRDYLRIMEEFNNNYGVVSAVASISGPLAALEEPERAARLLAASIAQLEWIGGSHQATDVPEFEEYRRVIRDRLGEAAFQEAWEFGSRMTFGQMVALAHADAP